MDINTTISQIELIEERKKIFNCRGGSMPNLPTSLLLDVADIELAVLDAQCTEFYKEESEMNLTDWILQNKYKLEKAGPEYFQSTLSTAHELFILQSTNLQSEEVAKDSILQTKLLNVRSAMEEVLRYCDEKKRRVVDAEQRKTTNEAIQGPITTSAAFVDIPVTIFIDPYFDKSILHSGGVPEFITVVHKLADSETELLVSHMGKVIGGVRCEGSTVTTMLQKIQKISKDFGACCVSFKRGTLVCAHFNFDKALDSEEIAASHWKHNACTGGI